MLFMATSALFFGAVIEPTAEMFRMSAMCGCDSTLHSRNRRCYEREVHRCQIPRAVETL